LTLHVSPLPVQFRQLRELFRRVPGLPRKLLETIAVSVVPHLQDRCHQFLAHVQTQNARLFHALHWQTLDEIIIHGHPHHLMQADLTWYPPITSPETGFLSHLKQAA